MVQAVQPASPRVRRKRNARRREILAAALGLVESGGLDGLTIKLVAEELDYAVGALYRYFPSKSALIAALQRETVDQLDALHEECMALCNAELPRVDDDETWTSLAPVAATVGLYSGYALGSPGAFGLLSLSLGDPRHLIDDDQASAVLAAAGPTFQRVGAHVDAAVDAGALVPGDGVDRAILLWASLHGVVQLGKLTRLDPDRIGTQPLARRLLEALLCGWGASPEAVRRACEYVDASRIVERALGEVSSREA